MSKTEAGFKNIALMGDHGGGQDALKQVASELDQEWSAKGAHVYYIPDRYYKSQELIRDYPIEHGLSPGRHAGIHDTSEVMFLDKIQKWIRKDKLASGTKRTALTVIRAKLQRNWGRHSSTSRSVALSLKSRAW